MASLQEFTSTATPELGDFQVGVNQTAPVSNQASNLNLAAHSAALVQDPQQVMEAYNTSLSEVSLEGKSQAAQAIFDTAKQQSFNQQKQALVNLLVDPNVSDEEKKQAALGVLDWQDSRYNIRNTLSTNALIAPSGKENSEMEFTRVNLADSVHAVNEYKREAQAILNGQVAAVDAETMTAFADAFQYFTPFVENKFAGTILDDLKNGDGHAYIQATAMLGSAKMDIKDMINSIPPEQRIGFTQAVVNAVNANKNIVMVDENDFAKVDYLRSFLEDGYYDDTAKWVDNVASILNIVGLGADVGRVARGVTRAARISEDTARNIRREAVVNRVQPTTISQNYKDTNPAKAQAVHEAAASDATGEASQALYGATREEAVVHDLAPQIGSVDNSVKAKVGNAGAMYDQQITPPGELMDFVNNNGAIHYWEAEKRQLRADVVNDFEQVHGMNARKEMFQVEDIPDGVKIRAMYGPAQGGFSSAEEAREMAKWALRDYGVEDKDIILMQRDGPNYYAVTDEQANIRLAKDVIVGGPGGARGMSITRTQPDFLVMVDHEYKFSPLDVAQWAEADVKYNIFDRIPAFNGAAGAGSLQAHVLDFASTLHPTIIKGANVAVDKAASLEKQLLDVGKTFTDNFTKLPKERQALLNDIIKEANDQGLNFDYAKMAADGLTKAEMDTLRSWKHYWDTAYWIENKDMARTLRARGYYEFVDEAHDTRLFAKPVSRQRIGRSAKVYDHVNDEIRVLSNEELSDLYQRNGTIAQLRQPVQRGDDAAEFIVSEEAAGKGYLRALNDSSQVLNYRKGYYSVHYKDPHFIVKVVKDKRGNVLYEKAVATAGNAKDADLMVRRMKAVDSASDFYRRPDLKKEGFRGDDHWDLQSARGRSAQKIRGKRLEDATSTLSSPAQANILGPVDSMILSARSIANRVSMRDYLEATKERFVNQFREYLPKDQFGRPTFPSKVDDVRYYGGHTPDNKRLADARTTFSYLRYMEDGYINHIDDGIKATLKTIADIAGNAGLTKTEKAFTWMGEARGLSAMGKNIAFNLYLALNPLRQLVVQSHQAVQLFANFPRWIMSGLATPQITILTSFQLGIAPNKALLKAAGMTLDEARQMFKEFDASGLVASIDKQNLIRGAMASLADQAAKKDFAPLTFLRRVGFDAGENVNMQTAWLAHRDAAIRAGKDVHAKDTLEEISALARNYTYNMNAAGDMPYNQNFLAGVFQFMQVPHKALTTMTTNRVLTPQQKLRLLGFNAVMYTLPPAAMYSWFGSILPDDPVARDAVVNGLEGAMLNKLLSLATGEETRIDWSGLSPFDLYGTMDFIHSLFTTDVGTILASTPSGQLLFGNNPRITNFAKTAARYFNLVDDYEDPTTFSQVALQFGKLSSGFSNAYKAAYAMEYGNKVNTLGGVTDSRVSTPEAMAQALGFGTLDEAQRYWVSNTTYEKSKSFEKDVTEWYKGLKQHMVASGKSTEEYNNILQVYSEAWRVWGNDNFKAKQIIDQLLRKDLESGDNRMYKNLLNMTGIMSKDELKNLVNGMPNITEEQRSQIQNTIDFIDSYKEP